MAAARIGFAAFVVAVAAHLTYYQFTYVPEVNTKPTFPSSILATAETVGVKIVQGASLESSPPAFVPKSARGIIGISNKVTCTNTDSVMHSVTSDNDYVDPINGRFNSVEHMGTLIGQNRMFSFTFVKVGQYHSSHSPLTSSLHAGHGGNSGRLCLGLAGAAAAALSLAALFSVVAVLVVAERAQLVRVSFHQRITLAISLWEPNVPLASGRWIPIAL